jgi:hypothetical protein
VVIRGLSSVAREAEPFAVCELPWTGQKASIAAKRVARKCPLLKLTGNPPAKTTGFGTPEISDFSSTILGCGCYFL